MTRREQLIHRLAQSGPLDRNTLVLWGFNHSTIARACLSGDIIRTPLGRRSPRYIYSAKKREAETSLSHHARPQDKA